MIGFDGLLISIAILELNSPGLRSLIIGTAVNARGHLDFAAHRFHFFGARFPHHARPFTRVAERIDQCLDNVGAVAVVMLRNQRVLDRAAEREAFDALRRPVG